MSAHKDRVRNLLKVAGLVSGIAFAVLTVVAKIKNIKHTYEDEPEQKNPMEGKRVIFVEDKNDKENADGVKGHLKAVGKAECKSGFYVKYIKRGLDIVLSFGGLVVLSPILFVTALAIYIDDPGPVLFTQKRVGQNKKYFKLHKFRSMKMCTPHDVPTHMLDNPDQYITNVGRFLRRHSIDELPQIWDIFVGNMSVIGPRPGLWNQDLLTSERDKYGANDIKPGLTGWAQINGRDELEIPEKARLDGEYVKQIGPMMDAKCFFRSVGVFRNDNSVVEGRTRKMNKEQLNMSEDIINDITGKKILFLAPAFFGYENKIAKKMEDLGANVDLYDVRSVTGAKDRALLKISPKIFATRSQKYYEKIIAENKDKNYDYILVIKCDMTPENILIRFHKEYPNAKLCLYLWDSINNIPGVLKKFKYFDTLHSFDMQDCVNHSELKFRPLFYADEFCKELSTELYKYDISFSGTIHSDRYAVIKAVKKIIAEKGLNSYWFCYLQSKFIYYFYKATKKEFADTKITDFDFQKKGSEEIASTIEQTKIVLDIQHPKQTGLTMRTIEMLGMNKKLITTNTSIKDYDFYNPNNISIIDRNNVCIDDHFLESPYEPLDDALYKKYSLQSWIFEVLS